MLTVEYWMQDHMEDLAMSTSGELATLTCLQTLIFLPVDATDFGGAVEHNENLSNLEIKERTAVMEELDRCMTSLLQPAFQHPIQKCLTPLLPTIISTHQSWLATHSALFNILSKTTL